MMKIAAIIAGLLSYAATLSAATFVLRPADEMGWVTTVLIAAGFELLFTAMKEYLFKAAGHPAGWIGLVLDGAVNTGGILPYGARLLTFGPILVILGIVRVDVSSMDTLWVGGAIVSAILGFVLSIVPHWLWHAK